MNSLSRRDCIKILALGGVVAFTPTPLWAEKEARPPTELLDLHAAAVIGTEYLKLFPKEADAKQLSTLIKEALPQLNSGDLSNPELLTVADAIDLAIRDDFANSHIIEVSGWLLSRLELRLCALVALTAKAS